MRDAGPAARRVPNPLPSRPISAWRARRLFTGTMFGFAAALALGCALPREAVSGPTDKEAGGSPAQATAPSIQEIALERRCFRCENQYKLTFRRDGAATRTSFGSAPVDRTFKGTVTPEEFAALATLMQREGFFDLNDTYRDPGLADGEWATTSAAADGRNKAVLNSNRVGPPKLKAIEDAIDALGKKVAWTEARL
jgi:hypothetical protein